MNLTHKFVYLLSLSFGLILIFAGVTSGDFTWYTLGSFVIMALILYSFMSFSDKRLILLIIIVFLYLRFIPIVKYDQPLYEDAVFDFKTAEVFRNDANFGIIESTTSDIGKWFFSRMEKYSGWPLIHLTAIELSDVTGISLFNVFTYFPPLIALSSVLFVYLLANLIFKDPKISALSALILATFPAVLHWQSQMIRGNIGYTLALMAIYLYIKAQRNKKIKITALSLSIFAIIPFAHHLTVADILLLFGFIFLITFILNLNFLRKTSTTISHGQTIKTPKPHSLTITLMLLVCVSVFVYWITYPRTVIFNLLSSIGETIVNSLTGVKEAQPYLTRYTPMYTVTDTYDILSITRILLLGITTLLGAFILFKERNRYGPFLYGLVIAPSVMLLIGAFVVREADTRHMLFLIVGVSLISAKVLHKLSKKILAICLLLILVPVPFKLDTLIFETPAYIYDRNRPYEFLPQYKAIYRNDHVLAASSFFAKFTNSNLKADIYTASGLLFFADHNRIHSLYVHMSGGYVIVIHQKYFDTHDRLSLPPDALEYIVEYIPVNASCIYDNGEVRGWKP